MVVLEGMDDGPGGRGRRTLGHPAGGAGRSRRLRAARRRSGAQLIAARERAFFVGKAAGCDDLIDAVLPRAIIPDYLAQVAILAQEHGAFVTGCGHIGDGNVHITVFQPDDERRHALMHASFELALAVGGAISGEHGIGTAKLPYFLEMEDPVSLDLMRSIKRAFDPAGILGPDRLLGMARTRSALVNGARSLLSTLVGAGVDVCFANPGTSEMHFVAALDDVPAMRGVLCLFEGVATGAADGYGRVAGRPAATLLHLGPGLGNGLANLHNARRARTPIVNIVGDHATYHARYDAPLQSDIASIARPVSGWYRSTARSDDVAGDAADAVAAAMGPPGCVATLVLPADASWSESTTGPCPPRPQRPGGGGARGHGRRGGQGPAGRRAGRTPARRRRAAGRRAAGRQPGRRHDGAALLGETFPANLERGAGIPAVERLAYLAEMAQAQLDGVRHLVLVDATSPVSFFAYPDKASDLVPAGCTVHVLAASGRGRRRRAGGPGRSGRCSRPTAASRHPRAVPTRPTGALTTETLAAAVGATLPEGTIVVDEGNTSGLFVSGATAGAPRHDWLTLTGGAIGDRAADGHGRGRGRAGAPASSACRRTAAPCTRCRPCGPRPARGST